MPTITDNGVCIRRWDYSETSQTVSLFLREHGIIRGIAKGAKREKGAFSGGIDLLTRGQVVAILKPGRELVTLTEWHLEEVYWALRQRLAANRMGLYMADLIPHLLTDLDPHPALFDAFTQALADLGTDRPVELTLLGFQWTLLVETGYQPQLDRDARTGEPLPAEGATLAFSASAGGVIADPGTPSAAAAASDRWRVRPETILLLRAQAAGALPESPDPAVLKRANRLLGVYLRALIGREPNAMRWAFSDPGRAGR
ncbi:MAG: DNA repair protein RecO [Myxococcota bacterium]